MKITHLIVVSSILLFESNLFYHHHELIHEHIHNEYHFDTFTNNFIYSLSGDSTNAISSFSIKVPNEKA